MGLIHSKKKRAVTADYVVSVRTGDKKGAGTDSNVYITMRDRDGLATEPKKLDVFFRDDFERGNTDSFTLRNLPRLSDIAEIDLYLEKSGVKPDWYVELIVIEDTQRNKLYKFPLHRWIRETKTMSIAHLDTSLPQYSPHATQRHQELLEKRELYEYAENYPGMPIQVRNYRMKVTSLLSGGAGNHSVQ